MAVCGDCPEMAMICVPIMIMVQIIVRGPFASFMHFGKSSLGQLPCTFQEVHAHPHAHIHPHTHTRTHTHTHLHTHTHTYTLVHPNASPNQFIKRSKTPIKSASWH